MEEKDLHDQLMLLFRKYFIARERWETKGFSRAGIDARNALAEIRIVARQLRKEIHIERKKRLAKMREEKRKKNEQHNTNN